MDFREVWMNSNSIGSDENPHAVAAKTCAQNLKTAEDNCIYLLALSIILLTLNVLAVLFFNRIELLKAFRARFQPLPHSETASSVFTAPSITTPSTPS
ncbi:unnamed protein product [Caenorhabditis sp. 36 PRJEB53466]|nr:unnamed protein product [Caenorhabditis sp. 36 PRJEB53466]